MREKVEPTAKRGLAAKDMVRVRPPHPYIGQHLGIADVKWLEDADETGQPRQRMGRPRSGSNSS